MGDYKTGRQPCQNFKPSDDLFEGSGNVHECMKHAPNECEGTRSFCENCCTDHHSNGYENCKQKHEVIE